MRRKLQFAVCSLQLARVVDGMGRPLPAVVRSPPLGLRRHTGGMDNRGYP